MRITLDLPASLLEKVMKLTKAKLKTSAITFALEEKFQISDLKKYKGKVN